MEFTQTIKRILGAIRNFAPKVKFASHVLRELFKAFCYTRRNRRTTSHSRTSTTTERVRWERKCNRSKSESSKGGIRDDG